MVELMKKLSLQNNLNQFNHRGILVFVLFGHKKAEAGEAWKHFHQGAPRLYVQGKDQLSDIFVTFNMWILSTDETTTTATEEI